MGYAKILPKQHLHIVKKPKIGLKFSIYINLASYHPPPPQPT